MKKLVLSTLVLSLLAVPALAQPQGKSVAERWKDDVHGEAAMKAGVLSPLKSVGKCGTGFEVVRGQPGDKTCFISPRGTLVCPNNCGPIAAK